MSKNIIKMPADPTCEPPPGGLGVLFMEKMKEYGTNLAQVRIMFIRYVFLKFTHFLAQSCTCCFI